MPGIVRQFGAKVQGRSHAGTLLSGAARLTFMTAIAAGILLTWQGITLQVQKFSVRPGDFTPVQAVAHWVQHAWTAAVQQIEAPLPQSTFGQEQAMSAHQLIDRWTPVITEASARYNVPATWIRAVVQMESGGRTMQGEDRPIVSRTGAMGLMQLMPGTYQLIRAEFRLGANPFNPRDNIYAGAAYLHQLYQHYGYPAMFAAYNDGPGHLQERLERGRLLPLETRNYVTRIVAALSGGAAKNANPAALQDGAAAKFTRPNGTAVEVKLADITAVRVPLVGEYPAGVNAVITEGKVSQAVRETYDTVKAAMLEHGALGQPVSGEASRFAALVASNLVRAATHDRSPERRHEDRRNVVAAHHRMHAEFRLADAGTIHLHQISHHARS